MTISFESTYDKAMTYKLFLDRIGRISVTPEEADVFGLYLDTAFAELNGQGLILKAENVEDNALIADYAQFVVYKGASNIPTSLDRRIRHRFLIDGADQVTVSA